ncbi:MAG: hypothetical protein M3Y87_20980 [Myxococcota bacterium]|nr:hypothetical protein [Myxococcota bacterium]
MSRIASSSLVLTALLILVPAASAQTTASPQATDDEVPAGPGDGTAGDGTAGDGTVTTTTTTTTTGGSAELGDEQALLEERAPVESGESGLEPRELPDVDYFFVGVLGRGLIVPTFIQNIFIAQGATPINGGLGAYFNYRRNGFNVQLEVFYQSFAVDGFYRGAGDPESETEFIHSELGVLFGSVGFGWAFDITEWFAFELGFGIGFGGVIGDLYRQEAYRGTGTDTYAACDGPGSPPSGDFCEPSVEMPSAEGRLDDSRQRGGTYQLSRDTPNPHYFGEGGVPPIMFTIDLPRIAFRFKPIRQIQIRVEGAYNLYGFSVGASAGYGF